MTKTSLSPVEKIQSNWCKYVQSPAQLGFLRLSKFPPDSGSRLVDILEIEKGNRVLEVGSGLGILASRIKKTDVPSQIIGCELNENYVFASLPDELELDPEPDLIQGDGFSLPVPDDSFDHLFTHTLATLLRGEAWTRFHEEIRRVVKTGGKVTHMDSIGGDSWSPEGVGILEEEEERKNKLFDLLLNVHRELETGYAHTARDLPKFFRESNFKNITVKTFASTLAFDNSDWTDVQIKQLLELWQRADRDRLERLKKLLEVSDRLNNDREELLEQGLSDVQQQAFRRRKAFQENEDLGWRSASTLAVTATL